jgi:hypothetical protein
MAIAVEAAAQYLASAYTLLRAIRDGWSDFELIEQNDAQFFYFVDTNIAIWYSDPRDGANLATLDLPNLRSDNSDGSVFLTSALTADYVFSGNLPGCLDNPCLLTPEHVVELLDHFEKNAVQPLDSTTSVRRNSAAEAEQAKSIQNALNAFQAEGEAGALNALVGQLSNLLRLPAASAEFRNARLSRLIETERVVSADRYLGLEIPKSFPKANLASQWYTRIESFKKPQKREDTENIHRDAICLAQLESLNTYSAMRRDNVFFVLISADKSIHSAVDAWAQENKRLGVPTRSFVRHPRQYVPILRRRESAIVRDGDDTFWQLRKAVEDLVFAYADLMKLPDDWSGKHFSDEILPGIEANIREGDLQVLGAQAQELVQNWRLAIQSSALLEARTLIQTKASYWGQMLGDLFESLSSGELERPLSRGVVAISRAHLALAIKGRIIGTVHRAARLKRKGRKGILPSRGPLLFRYRLGNDFLGIEAVAGRGYDGINALLDWAFEYANYDRVATFESKLLTMDFVSAYAMAAAAAYRAGAWGAARHFAERGEHAVMAAPDRKPEAEEMKYCRWVATRFLGTNLQEMQNLRLEIDRCLVGYAREENVFLFARAQSELAAIQLYFVKRCILDDLNTSAVSSSYQKDLLREASRAVTIGLRSVFTARRGRSKVEEPAAMWGRLEFQLRNNECTIILLNALAFGVPLELQASKTACRELRRLSQTNRRWRVGLGEVNSEILGAITTDDPDAKKRRIEDAKELLLEAPETKLALEELDLRYFAFLRRNLLDKKDI